MNNKLIRYCIIEPECRLRFAALVILGIILIGQLWYRGVQVRRAGTLQTELALVERIGDMEKVIRTQERLEAFINEQDMNFGDVKPTKISGFAMQKGAPSVLVDGTVYSEGSSFGEYVIVKITKKMITLVNKKTNAIKNLYVFE